MLSLASECSGGQQAFILAGDFNAPLASSAVASCLLSSRRVTNPTPRSWIPKDTQGSAQNRLLFQSVVYYGGEMFFETFGLGRGG
eukprot:489812-Amphidinium_carterae.1